MMIIITIYFHRTLLQIFIYSIIFYQYLEIRFFGNISVRPALVYNSCVVYIDSMVLYIASFRDLA